VRGNVVDVRFPRNLPALFNRLQAGDDGTVILEVQAHLSEDSARCIPLTPSHGLARGAPVSNTGSPLKVPVGKALLGRILNVLGETIDGGLVRRRAYADRGRARNLDRQVLARWDFLDAESSDHWRHLGLYQCLVLGKAGERP
jgi:F0F1-type ATP synthase beta subunit